LVACNFEILVRYFVCVPFQDFSNQGSIPGRGKDAMRRAVEVIEERAVERLQHFDLISIQTSPCSVHDEQGIKNKAHPKVDEEMKVIRMTHYVCIAMNYILFQLKVR
jgi:hypothetical protein